jgi:hypothetical protein
MKKELSIDSFGQQIYQINKINLLKILQQYQQLS